MSKSPRTLSEKATKIIWTAKTVGAADPDPHRIFTDSARGVAVFGVMLEGLSQGSTKAAKWITLAARIAWGIVEISVPRKPLYRLGRNWLGLLGFLGLGVVVLGVLNPKTGMINVGLLVLALTIATWVTSYYLGSWMKKGRPTAKRLAMTLILLLFAAATLWAGDYFAAHWKGIEQTIDPKVAWIAAKGGLAKLALLAAAGAIALSVAVYNLVRLIRRGDAQWKRTLAAAGLLVVGAAIAYLGWRVSRGETTSGVGWIGAVKGWWECLRRGLSLGWGHRG